MDNDKKRSDVFQPKWRHFHPNSTVWVNNPLGHDVTFQVADEFNQPYTYRMKAGKTSELPGGPIATLGVKKLVDELIQNDPKDVFNQWDVNVRAKYEKDIILRIKEAPQNAERQKAGEIDLTKDETVDDEDEMIAVEEEEPDFPTIVQQTKATTKNKGIVPDFASGALPAEDAEVEA